MEKKKLLTTPIDLVSLVNSHEKPFIVISKDYQVMAMNSSCEQECNISIEDSVNKMCYEVIRGRSRPCFLDGDECPHEDIFNGQTSGTPRHYDAERHSRRVKITAFPLKNADNELFLGKCIDEILPRFDPTILQNQMLGRAPAFVQCIQQLNMASNSDVPVLLQGETGVGKELAAHYIHHHSSRYDAPFQIIDSARFSENTFAPEMFGHTNGAFSGCVGDKIGLFELADGGTIFFDEIADLELPVQVKLLRLLDSGEFRRIGGQKMRSADVRIICCTNQNLWQLVQDGKFREDLYHRIACLNIEIPALRKRKEDIPFLAQTIMDDINRKKKTEYYLLPGVSTSLKDYTYPGNIRELKNILKIAMSMCKDERIDKTVIDEIIKNTPHANNKVKSTAEENQESPIPSASELIQKNNSAESLKIFERKHISDLLKSHQGNRKQAADALGISERTLYRKLKRLGIN